jgi:hypothetical protein
MKRLELLARAGLAPQAIYADSDGVADLAGTTTVLLEDTQVILRDPGGDAVAAETDGLEALLELWLAQTRPAAEDGATAPRHLQVYDATTEGWPNTLWEELQAQVPAEPGGAASAGRRAGPACGRRCSEPGRQPVAGSLCEALQLRKLLAALAARGCACRCSWPHDAAQCRAGNLATAA